MPKTKNNERNSYLDQIKNLDLYSDTMWQMCLAGQESIKHRVFERELPWCYINAKNEIIEEWGNGSITKDISRYLNRPIIYCVCGCNGVGKSTYIQAVFDDTFYKIDPDLIKREQNCSQLAAGKIAIKDINTLLKQKFTFIKESTLTSHLDFKIVENAKALKYRTVLVYIGVENPLLLIERIKTRVALGEHHIDDQIVMRRYIKSIDNVSQAINIFEKVFVIDNSEDKFKKVAIFDNSHLQKQYAYPLWFEHVTNKLN